jgi:hypothetical protein
MKFFTVSTSLVVAPILFFLHLQAFSGDTDKSRHFSLEDLVRKKLLEVNISGMGGHQGDCILMSLANLSPDTSFVRLEPGRILASADTLAQDILITREEMLALAPGERRSIIAFGFCCEASKASPDSAGMFSLGDMADSTIVVLAEFLDKKGNTYPEDAIQQAVWCLTDGYDVSGISGDDIAGIGELRDLVSGLQQIKYPGYGTGNLVDEEQPAPEYRITISGEVEIYISNECLVDIYICDREGKQWETFEEKVAYRPGIFHYSFQVTVINWPKGKYFLRVVSDDKLLYQKEFEI